MLDPHPAHQKALDHLMRYVIGMKNRGLVLSPTRIWDGNKDFEFVFMGDQILIMQRIRMIIKVSLVAEYSWKNVQLCFAVQPRNL